MILLEGPDRTGKTTTVMGLRSLLNGWSYRHHTKPPVGVTPYQYFGWFLADSRPSVIIDRLHWSEQAYANVYRQGPELNSHQWRLLELMLWAQGAEVICLVDDPESIASRYGPGEMHDPEGIPGIVSEYAKQIDGRSKPHVSRLERSGVSFKDLWHDWHEKKPKRPTDEFQRIINRAQRKAMAVSELPSPAMGMGYPGPIACGHGKGGFMVIGEAPSDKIYDRDMDPRVCWDKGPAADLLWQAIDRNGIDWSLGYFTNASAFNSPSALGAAIRLIAPETIITLGSTARECLKEVGNYSAAIEQCGCRVFSFEHPQYVRRFKANEVDTYLSDLGYALSGFREHIQGVTLAAS